MPAWIHDRAKHIRKKNPEMDEGQSFAIATQQAYAAGKAPQGYGTAEGRSKAKRKYDGPKKQYKKTADPSSKTKTSAYLAFLMGSSNDQHGDAEMLKTKLAGSQTHLATAIASVLDETRQKMKMAAEAKAEEKDEKKVKKLVDFEKKEHGGKIPSPKEEKEECKEEKKEASALVIDPTDPEEVEKLAAALDEMSEKLADAVVMGGESHQGGEVLPVQRPAAGTQPVPSKGKKTTSPANSPKPSDSTAAGEIVGTDVTGRVSKDYPAKGVLKTSSVAILQAALAEETGIEAPSEEEKTAAEDDGKAGRVAKSALTSMLPFGGAYQGHKIGENEEELARREKRAPKYGRTGAALGTGAANWLAGNVGGAAGHVASGGHGGAALAGALGARALVGGFAGAKRHEQEQALKKGKKKAASAEQSAVDYLLGKIAGAELGGEKPQGGETLASHDKPKMQPGRSLIQNAQNLKNVTKPEAKAARKAELAEVLTEPASKRGQAPDITGNLRSASKGGVKTAAAKALLAKIAEEGCKCEEKGSCPHCKMKKAAAEIRNRQATDQATA